ncbi:hypothetical protein BC826DRAFT_993645 [Russula brevipes]|nr:hypothetical protein BC826DRAFT_993645 [Russula brevipes]
MQGNVLGSGSMAAYFYQLYRQICLSLILCLLATATEPPPTIPCEDVDVIARPMRCSVTILFQGSKRSVIQAAELQTLHVTEKPIMLELTATREKKKGKQSKHIVNYVFVRLPKVAGGRHRFTSTLACPGQSLG